MEQLVPQGQREKEAQEKRGQYQAMNGLVCCEFRLALSRMVI